MNQTIIYLIRHSIPKIEVKDGQRLMYGPDASLSPEGEQKARTLADAILAREGKPLEVFVSSTHKRAYQTACILAEQMKIGPVISHSGLVDTKSLWGGVTMDEIGRVARTVGIFNDPRTLETESEIAERMVTTFNQIISQYSGRLLGVVSHGDPLRLLYNHFKHYQQDLSASSQLIQELNLGTAQSLRLEFSPDCKEPVSSEKIPEG